MRDRQGSLETLRQQFAQLPGVAPLVGGFISHQIDEVLSGVRSAIAIKVFGPELPNLRAIAQQVEAAIRDVPGIADLQVEPQVPIRQLQIRFDRAAAARYGLRVGDLAETIETALNGRVVSQVLEQQQVFDLLVWLTPKDRSNLATIGNLLVDTPDGKKIPLSQVSTIEYGTGPNTINRENVSRLIVVSANAQRRDLGSVIRDIRARIKEQVSLPQGYYIQYGGQFEAEEQASQTLLIAIAIALIAIAILMYFAVKSIPSTLMILINLP